MQKCMEAGFMLQASHTWLVGVAEAVNRFPGLNLFPVIIHSAPPPHILIKRTFELSKNWKEVVYIYI